MLSICWWRLLFCQYDEGMLVKLEDTIALFEWCSGKNQLYTVTTWMRRICSLWQKSWIVKQFLLRLFTWAYCWGYPRQVAFWQPVIDQIHKKLGKWRRFNLSIGGKTTLCNIVLANLPKYYMSFFAMPNKVVSSIERIIRNLLWEDTRGVNLIIWWRGQSNSFTERWRCWSGGP